MYFVFRTTSSLTSANISQSASQQDEIESDMLDDELSREVQFDEQQKQRIFGFSESPGSSVSSKKRKGTSSGLNTPTSETNEILREFLANRPKASDFIPQKPADDVQQFFDSMASTVRKFTPVTIAKIKLKIAQIVGEEEIAWAEEQARMQVIYVDPETSLNETMTN